MASLFSLFSLSVNLCDFQTTPYFETRAYGFLVFECLAYVLVSRAAALDFAIFTFEKSRAYAYIRI